jgi:hypothetical protein
MPRFDRVVRQWSTFGSMPEDVLKKIFMVLDTVHKIVVSTVCKEWYHILCNCTDERCHWGVTYDIDKVSKSVAPQTRSRLIRAKYTERCVVSSF